MGHVYDKNHVFLIPAVPAATYVSAGAATITTPKSGALWYLKIVAGGAGASVVVDIPVRPRPGQAETAQKGFYFRFLDLWYYVANDISSLNLGIYLGSLPADGAAFAAPASQAFTYDTGHDTNGERVDPNYHKVTLSITTPFWILDSQHCHAEYALSMAAAGQIYLIIARARGYLRW